MEHGRTSDLSSRTTIRLTFHSPPVLTATQGDVIIVHATNSLDDDAVGTSLHSHGMFFNHSNWYDGAVGVNQCPIPNGQTLDYTIDTTVQVGTYWIHGHLDGQNTDGLRSPVVIFPQNGTGRTDNVTWDAEYIVTAADWQVFFPFLIILVYKG